MLRSTKNDLSVLKALEYLISAQHGYMDELKKMPLFNDEIIQEFCSMSFMKTGYTQQKQTWAVLPFAEKFYSIVK